MLKKVVHIAFVDVQFLDELRDRLARFLGFRTALFLNS